MNNNQKEPQYLDIKQASEYLNLRISRLRYAVFRRQIPFLKIGGLVRFERAALDLWMKTKTVTIEEQV